MEILRTILMGFSYFILGYAIYCVLMESIQTLVALVISHRETRLVQSILDETTLETPELVPISIIAPARNESAVVLESLNSFLSLNYPVFEVVLINDGSTDDTLEKVIKEYRLQKSNYPVRIQVPCATIRGIYLNPEFPNLVVVDKESAGNKADASNAGINVSRYPYFVGMDVDCLLDEDSLVWISRHFMANQNVKAVGGVMRLSNGNTIQNGRIVGQAELSKKSLVRYQTVEYFRSFLVGRVFWSSINALMIISGAFGAFEKETAIAVGGYSLRTAGEDMDLVVKIHQYMKKKKKKYKIIFSPKAICWTQAPETLKDFKRQRRRWAVGNMQVVHRYKSMLFNPKYGTVGLVAMPYYLLYEYLGPAFVLLGILIIPLNIYFQIVTWQQIILLLFTAILIGIIMSLGALIVNTNLLIRTLSMRDFMILIGYCFLENFTFRPYNLFLRISVLFRYKKYLHVWDNITRQSYEDTHLEEEDLPPNITNSNG